MELEVLMLFRLLRVFGARDSLPVPCLYIWSASQKVQKGFQMPVVRHVTRQYHYHHSPTAATWSRKLRDVDAINAGGVMTLQRSHVGSQPFLSWEYTSELLYLRVKETSDWVRKNSRIVYKKRDFTLLLMIQRIYNFFSSAAGRMGEAVAPEKRVNPTEQCMSQHHFHGQANHAL
ncbi:hypothetical protein BGW80DRAFT_14251 [Lactifluus volemus]|nr:hypothetical protein BGW80DRAFT_14251 [Lactifluus volemus]